MKEFGLRQLNMSFWCTEDRRARRVLKVGARARLAGLGQAGQLLHGGQRPTFYASRPAGNVPPSVVMGLESRAEAGRLAWGRAACLHHIQCSSSSLCFVINQGAHSLLLPTNEEEMERPA